MKQWIHEPSDGKGARRVLLNGEEIGRVVYADERKGFVRIHDNPPKLDKYKKRIIERTLHGAVVVLPKGAE